MDAGDLQSYSFELPSELIARYPTKNRGDSRLMVIHYKSGQIEHRAFGDLDEYLKPGDLMVRNRTRVLPARVSLKGPTGKIFEVLFLDITQQPYRVLLKGARRLKDGAVLRPVGAPSDLTSVISTVNEKYEDDFKDIEFVFSRDKGTLFLRSLRQGKPIKVGHDFFERLGAMPIPPYFNRPAEELDKERYQTVFAASADEASRSSVAAPTAGLHFTQHHLDRLAKKGVNWAEVSLAIGYGTFAPPGEDNFVHKNLHQEWVEIPATLNQDLEKVIQGPAKLVAVGTTSLRSLEGAAVEQTNSDDPKERLRTGAFTTDIFIFPPYQFRVVQNLLTNFHLPASSLFLLVCALGGAELVKRAYREAVREKYRFFSYGDACLFLAD